MSMYQEKKTAKKAKRTRQNRIEVYLNDEELHRLDEFAQFCRGDRSKCIRQLLALRMPAPAPSVEVTELTKQLRALGFSLNQLAAKAHSLGFIDSLTYRENADAVMRLCGEIREAFAAGGVSLGNY